ncbi:translocase [Cognatishimia sp. SS12]|uniref:translocase n=1 Tax=Cognatishimia sp. SS12 TaxID=2979465 RepID=UPI002331418D|nr:translocase [Cognatishimia sp. SS12]MDC0737688.1 translocase [Cognatishimia sp. SS12]
MKLVRITERSRRIVMAGATFSVAVAAGLFVQSGAPTEAAAVVEAPAKTIAPAISASNGLPQWPRFDDTNTAFPIQRVALNVASDQPTRSMPSEVATPLLQCSPRLSAQPAVAALVNLEVTASCLPGARVVISHAGLSFTELLDDEGALAITVPALHEEARFDVTFPNGNVIETSAAVPSLRFYDRAALQWQGETGLQIHALEFGAEYGGTGHVWYGHSRDLSAVIGGNGGFLLRLGDGLSEVSQMVDVYTFPSGSADRDGTVALSVEVEVNGSNCNRDISATSLQMQRGGSPTTRALEIAMPDCGATGDFLVLKNLLQDLTIAQK